MATATIPSERSFEVGCGLRLTVVNLGEAREFIGLFRFVRPRAFGFGWWPREPTPAEREALNAEIERVVRIALCGFSDGRLPVLIGGLTC
ncbi:MAG: hypothetical protein J7605_17230 [Variovorax sp.]|nr:hypothetical protein [Variovorax sp.]